MATHLAKFKSVEISGIYQHAAIYNMYPPYENLFTGWL